MLGSLCQGWYSAIEHCPSSHFNARPLLPNGGPVPIDLLVIHNISLPAGCFATPYVRELFLAHWIAPRTQVLCRCKAYVSPHIFLLTVVG